LGAVDDLERLPEGSVTSPLGFRAGAVYAGLKTPGPDKLDLAVLVADQPCAAHGLFTTNRVVAAPVLVSRERLASGRAQGVVVNAGNANACTGPSGLAHAREMADRTARRFGLDPEAVLVASTGVIGVPFPIDKVRAGLDRLELAADGGAAMARAIMTTDTRPKMAAVRLEVMGRTVTIGGVAKGAGMIHPSMATMLAFLTTDAHLDPGFLRGALTAVVDRTFNMVTVDGDTSTNDTVLLLANGAADHPPLTSAHPDAARFQAALEAVASSLARMIAADGEGATRLIEVQVRGARTEADARRAARAVAASSLVKAAVYGGDPNWGRILCAVGYSGAEIDPGAVDVALGDVVVARAGRAADFDPGAASAALRGGEVVIRVDLHLGEASAVAWGCDLTEEYVVVNSKYTT